MKIPIIFLTALVLFQFPPTLDAQEMNIRTAREKLEELASADDLDDELRQNWLMLKQQSGSLFTLWHDVVRSSESDLLIQTTMVLAGAAPPEKSKELSDLAITLLTQRDATKFPLAIESAIKTLGTIGGAENTELIQQFERHSNGAISLAAQKTLESLRKRQTPFATETPAVKQQPAPKNALDPEITPKAQIDKTASSTPWGIIALSGVVVVGLMMLLLKRRS
jgi:hypothetical protein